MAVSQPLKPLVWIVTSKSDPIDFPQEAVGAIGYAVYAFQKKAKSGIGTPKALIALEKSRLKRAEEQHWAWRTELKDAP
jgi:phage-related protein